MGETTKVDGDGNVLEVTVEPQRITVSFERANTEYGNGPKAGVHVQVPLPADADDETVTLLTNKWGDWAREYVDGELEKAGAPNRGGGGDRKPRGGGGGRKGGGGGRRLSDEEYAAKKQAAWEHLAEHPEDWFDNRNDPDKPEKGPDFKGKKGTSFEGFGLWEDGRP
jgi:hypothetical protein